MELLDDGILDEQMLESGVEARTLRLLRRKSLLLIVVGLLCFLLDVGFVILFTTKVKVLILGEPLGILGALTLLSFGFIHLGYRGRNILLRSNLDEAALSRLARYDVYLWLSIIAAFFLVWVFLFWRL